MNHAQFGLFDPDSDLQQTRRYLPHWFQPNVAVFLTFRTADSLPKETLMLWHREQIEWLREAGMNLLPTDPIPEFERIPTAVRDQFRRHKGARWNWHLDSCHGVCPLRQRPLAECVVETLRHFDGERYDLDSLIVMPNHVHLLVQFRSPTTCRDQCTSWLRYSARQLNAQLGSKGAFWQSEPFDHLVRSSEQFAYLQRYIAENGTRARLPSTDFLYWTRS